MILHFHWTNTFPKKQYGFFFITILSTFFSIIPWLIYPPSHPQKLQQKIPFLGVRHWAYRASIPGIRLGQWSSCFGHLAFPEVHFLQVEVSVNTLIVLCSLPIVLIITNIFHCNIIKHKLTIFVTNLFTKSLKWVNIVKFHVSIWVNSRFNTLKGP